MFWRGFGGAEYDDLAFNSEPVQLETSVSHNAEVKPRTFFPETWLWSDSLTG